MPHRTGFREGFNTVQVGTQKQHWKSWQRRSLTRTGSSGVRLPGNSLHREWKPLLEWGKYYQETIFFFFAGGWMSTATQLEIEL